MSAMRTGVIVSILLSVVCLSSIASAQTNWARTYGGSDDEEGYSVEKTTDGGYIIAGYTNSFGAGWHDVYLIKTNTSGDTLWTRTYGGRYHDEGHSARQTADGGYIIAGSIDCPSPTHSYLVKTDAQGDTLWTRVFGDPIYYNGMGYSALQTPDGGYVMAGTFGGWSIYLQKTDARGDHLWNMMYAGDVGYSVQQTADSGFVIAGRSGGHFCLLRTKADGATLWTKTYRGTDWGDGYFARQTADGGFMVTGHVTPSDSVNADVYLIKTNALGDTLWTRTYGGTYFDRGCSVLQTADGGYIITGATASFGAGNGDVYLIRTDDQGDTLWTRTYGGTDLDRGCSVLQTTDGGYIITGTTASLGAGGNDVYLIKTDGELDVGPVAILSPPGIVDSGSAYTPRVVVRNFGLTSGSIVQVTMNIGSGYSQAVQETLVSVPLDTVVFPAWTAEPVGSVAVKCFTSLLGDEEPANDTIVDTVQVLPAPIHDVGAAAIISPSGNVRAGDTVIPRATIRNFGNRQERYFDVRFRIGASYNEKVNVADALPAGSTAELTFPPWVAEVGDWAVNCSTMLGSDENRANDRVSSSVQVFPQSLSVAPDQSDRIEAGQSKTYRFCALIQGDTGAVVEVTRPSPQAGWNVRLCNAAGTQDLTDTDADGLPDLGYVAPGESGWFSLDVTAPSGTQGDTASLGQGVFVVAGHVGDRPDIADTAVLSLALMPAFSVHNFPNPFSDHTAFVLGLPEDGKASLTVYTRAGERVCRVIKNAEMPAGVHLVRWDGVNDNGRGIAPGTYEYLLDYVHSGKTDRIHKKLVLTKQ